MSQAETILGHLREYGSITAIEAVRDYGIMRLASRIADLRKAGVPVQTEMVQGKNRHGEKVNFARYRLNGGETDG